MSKLETNQRIGHLTLKERVPARMQDGRRRAVWKCVCDCGKEVVKREDYLTTTNSKPHSCGHDLTQYTSRRREKAHQWAGCGDIDGNYFCQIRLHANRKGLDVTITKQEAWDLFLKQDRRCKLSGLPLEFHTTKEKSRGLQQTASLDRLDSAKGYAIDNCQWIHKELNMMKREMTQERMIELCRLVAEHNKPKEAEPESFEPFPFIA